MAVGTQATVGSLNQQLTNYVTTLRDLLASIQYLQAFVVGEGQAGLVAIGFTSGDATTYANDVSYLNTIAGVFFGTATQGSAFSFESALAGVTAGN